MLYYSIFSSLFVYFDEFIFVCENSFKYSVALISDYFPRTKRALFFLPSSIFIAMVSVSNRPGHFSHLGSASHRGELQTV